MAVHQISHYHWFEKNQEVPRAHFIIISWCFYLWNRHEIISLWKFKIQGLLWASWQIERAILKNIILICSRLSDASTIPLNRTKIFASLLVGCSHSTVQGSLYKRMDFARWHLPHTILCLIQVFHLSKYKPSREGGTHSLPTTPHQNGHQKAVLSCLRISEFRPPPSDSKQNIIQHK